MKKGKEFLEFGTYAEKFPGINNKKISYYVCKATSAATTNFANIPVASSRTVLLLKIFCLLLACESL